jgi:hypothetical protein
MAHPNYLRYQRLVEGKTKKVGYQAQRAAVVDDGALL